MSTTPDLRDCFDELVELSLAQRELWFATHPLDPSLREELLSLLASDAREAPILNASAAELIERYTPQEEDGAGLIGSNIGPYRLIEVLGQGGTSVVFRAQRASGTGVQTVALKLMRTGLFSADGQRRFRREQGVLAQLSHPHIASLVDGGITEAGIPYIAMEFVDGTPITHFASAKSLGLQARLRLLVKVCRAIDSAHRALIVHRDLKPSNVLVNADGEIKVLDFGIARLLNDDEQPAMQTGAIALTPGYAAPEQYQPGPITTATDIFALGIMLGELLTGRLLPAAHTRSDLSRACMEQTVAIPAGMPPAALLARQLRGDLDAIYNTAHALDPGRRYLSATLLADDIERYLRNEPVTARVPSTWYRLRKSMQRNRAVAIGTMLGSLALTLGVSVAMWQAHVAREEAEHATAVSSFLVELFGAAKAGQLPDQRLTLDQLVQRAGERLRKQSDLSTATRIELLRTLGEVRMAGSDYPQARLLFDEAFALSQQIYALTDPAPRRIRLLQARLLLLESRYVEASIAYEALLPQLRNGSDPASVEGLQNYASALMYSARTDSASAIANEAAQRAAIVYGADSLGSARAQLVHGNLLVGAGRYADAGPILQSALKSWRDHRHAPTVDYLQALTDLSRVHQIAGQSAEAGALLRETLATAEQLYDAPHDRVALALLNLGDHLRQQGAYDEARGVLTRALTMMQTIYGAAHVRVANALGALGRLELRQRDLGAAAEHIHAATQWCEQPTRHATRSCIELYAAQTELALTVGDFDGADASSARALEMTEEIFRQDHHWAAQLWQLRAELSLRRNDPAAALALCDQALSLLSRLEEQNGRSAEAVLWRRAKALEAAGRFNDALVDINRAILLWQQLAPSERLHKIELLDTLASVQAHLGAASLARDAARRALTLVTERTQTDPAVLARIETLARDESSWEIEHPPPASWKLETGLRETGATI